MGTTRSSRRRRLSGAAVLAAVAVLGGALAASATEPPGTPGAPVLDPTTLEYTHLRVTLVGNSGWGMVTFTNLEIIDHRDLIGVTSYGTNTMSFSPGTGAPQTRQADLLVSTPIGSSVSMTITKGDANSFRVDVDSVSPAGATTGVVDVTNSLIAQPNQNAQTTSINRTTLLTDEVDVGPTDTERLVIAAVHPWYDGSEFNNFGTDKPDDPWTWDDAGEAADQVEAMADADIDVAAYSYGWPNYATDPKIDNLLDGAEADGRLRVAPIVEMESPSLKRSCTLLELLQGCSATYGTADTTAVRTLIGTVVDDADNYPGVFLERDGRPVVFFYSDQLMTNTATWNGLVAAFAGDGNAIFPIIQSTDPARTADGWYSYIGPANFTETQLTEWARARTMQERLRSIVEPTRPQRVVVGTVWPGYDDTSEESRAPNFRVEDRDDGDFYDSRWVAVLRGLPDWVMVTSWNEWYEQTHIAPSLTGGTDALVQTGDWAAVFHGP